MVSKIEQKKGEIQAVINAKKEQTGNIPGIQRQGGNYRPGIQQTQGSSLTNKPKSSLSKSTTIKTPEAKVFNSYNQPSSTMSYAPPIAPPISAGGYPTNHPGQSFYSHPPPPQPPMPLLPLNPNVGPPIIPASSQITIQGIPPIIPPPLSSTDNKEEKKNEAIKQTKPITKMSTGSRSFTKSKDT